MKKVVFALLLIAAIFGCAKIGPVTLPTGVVTIEAQSLPINKTLAWDASANATGYIVTLDGVTIGTPTGLTQPFTITTLGTHTFTVVATNLFGSSTPATLIVNVVLPSIPANLKIQ